MLTNGRSSSRGGAGVAGVNIAALGGGSASNADEKLNANGTDEAEDGGEVGAVNDDDDEDGIILVVVAPDANDVAIPPIIPVAAGQPFIDNIDDDTGDDANDGGDDVIGMDGMGSTVSDTAGVGPVAAAGAATADDNFIGSDGGDGNDVNGVGMAGHAQPPLLASGIFASEYLLSCPSADCNTSCIPSSVYSSIISKKSTMIGSPLLC